MTQPKILKIELKEALKSAGVEVSDTITRIGEAMKKAMGA